MLSQEVDIGVYFMKSVVAVLIQIFSIYTFIYNNFYCNIMIM
jgi:hypothetical protein